MTVFVNSSTIRPGLIRASRVSRSSEWASISACYVVLNAISNASSGSYKAGPRSDHQAWEFMDSWICLLLRDAHVVIQPCCSTTLGKEHHQRVTCWSAFAISNIVTVRHMCILCIICTGTVCQTVCVASALQCLQQVVEFRSLAFGNFWHRNKKMRPILFCFEKKERDQRVGWMGIWILELSKKNHFQTKIFKVKWKFKNEEIAHGAWLSLRFNRKRFLTILRF